MHWANWDSSGRWPSGSFRIVPKVDKGPFVGRTIERSIRFSKGTWRP